MTKIPEVQRGIISSILVEIAGPQKDPHWTDNMFTQLEIDNPIMAEYLLEVREKFGEQAAMAGLVVYKLIKSQMASDELEELFEEAGE